MKHLSIVGNKYNRLTAIKYHSNKPIKYVFLCDCGKTKIADIAQAKYGRIKSCGCLNNEKRKTSKLIHGESHSITYNTWKNMQARCTNKNNKAYANYGGRGITICNHWSVFNNFLHDMGKKPSTKFQIERLDNNKGYYKENCTWATVYTQQRNRRSTNKITYHKKTQCLTDGALELGLSRTVLSARLNKLKWSIEKAFNTPLLRQSKL